MNGDALSDLLLALVTWSLAWRLINQRPGLAISFGLIGFAATIGALRFAGIDNLLGPHRFASLLAACAGLPLLAASVYWPEDILATRSRAAAYFVLIIGAIGVALVTVWRLEWWAQLLPAIAIVLLVSAAVAGRNFLAMLATALLVGGFVASAVQLQVGNLSSIQLLHLLLASGLGMLAFATQRGTSSRSFRSTP